MGKWGTSFDILRDTVYGLAQYLDLYEQATLFFIWGRTQFYGKDWAPIPHRHFLKGVWSKQYGCITPRTRISEKKLLDSLRSLEEKGILQVERAVTKANRYRILPRSEINEGKIAVWNFDNNPKLCGELLRQLNDNLDILNKEHLALLLCLDEMFAEQRSRKCRTDNVTTTAPVRLSVPPRIGERKIPKNSNKPMKVIPRRVATPHAVSLKSKTDVAAQDRPIGLPILPRPTARR